MKLDKLFSKSAKSTPLFILEMANNHMGDLFHGKKIINEFAKVTSKFPYLFAFKFQFRDIDTFIHPDFKKRSDLKYVKRFSETRLSKEQFKTLKKELTKNNFISICTPFDEKSVDLIEELNFDIIKIGSCSFTDWPLLERVVKSNKPVIASTAGATIGEIDKVVSFFQHREKKFAILHCVGQYPTPTKNLQLNQINLLQSRYPDVVVGYSTHEEPDNYEAVKIAVAKGARIFEKHIGVATDKYELNPYSATPEQVKKWLEAVKSSYAMCGIENKRPALNLQEQADLRQFKRGVFAKRIIKKGEKITEKDLFLAFPNEQGQLVANELSKYQTYIAKKDFNKNEALLHKDILIEDVREKVYKIVTKVQKILLSNNIAIPDKVDFEISHHYGIDKFTRFGGVLINCVNREYSKKLVVIMPGQIHPTHLHKKKEETFHILTGDFLIYLNGKKVIGKPGDIITVERGVKHSFESKKGGILEEISSTHYVDDSFYDDSKILNSAERKTFLTFWRNL